uniref:WD domain, G-beta repeat-containing protein n=1 Tax=Toxoplasma gondii TgCATBr9 TaxID=943120 RepID=A0A2T6IEA2_TOXGO|nr:WD domain, G-beta repeat-containing protein [Toxoplasma gondii TgCATBr9]
MASAEAVPVVVTLGTYDGGLMGYTVQPVSPEGKGDYSRQTQSAERLKLTFAVNAHVVSYPRTASCCQKFRRNSPSLRTSYWSSRLLLRSPCLSLSLHRSAKSNT